MELKITEQVIRISKSPKLGLFFTFLFASNLIFANIYEPWCTVKRPLTPQSGTISTGCASHAAIEEVRIQQDGQLIFRKSPDGCSGPFNANTTLNTQEFGRVINTSLNPVVLSAGATYQIGISASSARSTVTSRVAMFIDYDRNFAFSGAAELITPATAWTVNAPLNSIGAVSFYSFTIPCSASEGLTRIRITTDDNTTGHITQDKGCVAIPGIPTARPWYGETEDMYIRIEKSTTLSADFIIPSQVYVGSPVTFTNTNRSGYISHTWDIGPNGVINFTGTDFTTTFGTAGTQSLKINSTNCLGTADVTKIVNIVDPTSAPIIDFIASKNNVELGSELILYDISDQGPNTWSWQLNSSIDPSHDLTNADATPIGFLGAFNRVRFNMNNLGTFNTCLTATNSIGSNQLCKNSYINVVPASNFVLGTNSVTDLSQGVIYDNGGIEGNYLTGSPGAPGNNRFLISPCGATSISLDISLFKFADNSHNLRVWDGTNSSGIPLHPVGGFNRTNAVAPFSVVANSGYMYIELNTFNGNSTDSGLVASFNAVLGQVAKPIPAFDFAITGQTFAYTNAVTSFESKTTNILGFPSYNWRVDNVTVSPTFLSDGGQKLNFPFPSAGTYDVCIDVSSCSGDSSFCNSINVVNPNIRTNLDITTSTRRPKLGQTVTLNVQADVASNFTWSISPLTYTLINGTTLNDRSIQVQFNEAIPYNISVIGWNSFDYAGTVSALAKDSFIIVVDYCNVNTPVLSSDIGNNLLSLSDANGTQFYAQSSESGSTVYEDFSSFEQIPLQVGGVYNISMTRNTNFNNISRRIYADWNGNGVFESNEIILDSPNDPSKVATSTFKVPNILNVIDNSPLRLRAISTFGTDQVQACGSLSVGEVEDYTMYVSTYNTKPMITLNGENLVYTELGMPYEDLEAIAYDVVEGDISDRMVITSNVNTNMVGLYTVRFNVTNGMLLNANEVVRTVVVTPDNTKPVLTLLGNNPDYLEVNTLPYQEPGFTATDNFDGNITSLVTKTGNVDHTTIGNYILNYSVLDASGNSASAQRQVEVGDKTPPVINLVGDTTINLGSVWSDLTFATDNYWSGTDLQFNKTYGFSGMVNSNVRGVYTVHYHAIDGSGNETKVSRNYRVDDFMAPTIVLNTPETITHDVFTPYTRVAPTVFDNISSQNDISIFASGEVNTNVLGTYIETFTATDLAGNTATATRTINVVDRIAPTIVAPYICTPQFNVFNNKHGVIVEDNYYAQNELMDLIEITNSNVNIFFEGVYTANYQVTDPSGNRSEMILRTIEVNNNCEIVSSVDKTNFESQIDLYPNPNNGSFNLNLGQLADQINSVLIYNSIGEAIFSTQLNGFDKVQQIKLDNLADGIYSVKLEGNNISVTKRFIVIK